MYNKPSPVTNNGALLICPLKLLFFVAISFCLFSFSFSNQAFALDRYSQGVNEFNELLQNNQKGMLRDSWDKLSTIFQKVENAGGANAQKALFYRGRTMEELAARSKRLSDSEEAADIFAAFAFNNPKDPFADEALIRRARMQAGRINDPAAAKETLNYLVQTYPATKYKGEAVTLGNRLGNVKPTANIVAQPANAPSAESITKQKALYENAVQKWQDLKNDKSGKAGRRDLWEDVEISFENAKHAAPNGPMADRAAFQLAKSREELASRSHSPSDWEVAARLYSEAASHYPKSSLADDSLLYQAKIYYEKLNDKPSAELALQKILSQYPDGDMFAEATRYLRSISPDGAQLSNTTESVKPQQQSSAQQSPQASEQKSTSSQQSNSNLNSVKADTKPVATKNTETKITYASGSTGDANTSNSGNNSELASLSWSGDKDNFSLTATFAGKTKYRRTTLTPQSAGKNNVGVQLDFLSASLDSSIQTSLNFGSELVRSVKTSQPSKGSSRIVLVAPNAKSYRISIEYNPYRITVEFSSKELLAGGYTMRGGEIAAKPATTSAAKPSASATTPPAVQSRAVTVTPASDPLGLAIRRIIIDAGHGGKDPGAMGNGITEKNYTLLLAKSLGERLQKRGITVLYTRDTDRFLELKERTAFANDNRADIFISIHVNSSESKSLNGIETYYLAKAQNNAALKIASRENAVSIERLTDLQIILSDLTRNVKEAESRELSYTVQEKMLSTLKNGGFAVRSNGSRPAPFYVLLGARMPAILVEIGYLSNTSDAARIKNSKYMDKIADGILAGIVAYKHKVESK